MSRIDSLDTLRGIAFIFMIIHHIHYFVDVSNDYSTSYSGDKLINNIGYISRTMFILLAGYSMNLSVKKNNKEYMKRRFFRSMEVIIHGIIISCVSYLTFPNNFVRFGILHFIGLSTLLVAPVVPYKLLTLIALVASIQYKFPRVNNIIDTITGSSVNYNMLDYFPLNSWLPVLLCGVTFGQYFNLPNIPSNSVLSYFGKEALNLYTLHVVIFLILAKIKNTNQ
jgi:uncharacterized membrane protein